jgi:Trypsin-like peptidase domain
MPYSNFAKAVYAVGRRRASGLSLLGTATLLNKPGRFVTAAHVTNRDDADLVVVYKSSHQLTTGYQDTSDNQVQIVPARIEAIDPFTDLCILNVDGMDICSNISLGSTDMLSEGSVVDIFGYPHADTGRFVLTYQRAEIGARILVKNGEVKTKQIVTNTLARPGQSGSPIFSFQTTIIVAILLGSYEPGGGAYGIRIFGGRTGSIDPAALHQTTHAISAEYITEML